jgi:putative methionine-R-sulfoxide reductase with GAF domain
MTGELPKNWQEEKHSEITEGRQSELLQAFAIALKAQDSAQDLVWELVNQVNKLLNYEDCVLYLYDEDKESLIQMAAFGIKKVNQKNIIDPIRIEPGEGIVGRVFLSGMGRVIGDTSLDGNYIIDDRFRLSEISIPILFNDEVIGVIDSEHPTENYYTNNDLTILSEVAELFAAKLNSF